MVPTIYVEPYAGVLPVVRFVEAAKRELMLNEYFIDDPDVLQAIGADTSRGVKVYVQIAGNPYRMSQDTVSNEEAALQAVGAVVRIAPPQFEGEDGHYSFDHAKYGVSDQGVLIATANLSQSAMDGRNREYIYTSNDPALVKALSLIFVADFTGQQAPDVSQLAPELVVSPGAEYRMVSILDQPGPKDIEVEEVGSDRSILQALESQGSSIRLIVPRNGVRARVLGELQAAGVQVRFLEKPYPHGKVIVDPRKFGFFGSENFSPTSERYNREIGVQFGDMGALTLLEATFQKDWQNANPASEE